MNLCYDALDLAVIRGRATEAAVLDAARTVDFATALEETAALAGALRALGAEPDTRVTVDLVDGYDELVAVLAALRLGAQPAVGSGTPGTVTAGAATIVRGEEVSDPESEVTWQEALRAGRTDPAPAARSSISAEVLPEQVARRIASLVRGEPVDLRG